MSYKLLDNNKPSRSSLKMASVVEYPTLQTKWPQALDLAGSNMPCRLEGEVGDLVVLGEIPSAIDGTFY